MIRAAWLAVALVLASVALASAWGLAVTGAFLVEFLTEGRVRALSSLTPTPTRVPLAVPGPPVAADLYRPVAVARPPGLVLVHGLAPRGKDEVPLVEAAALLARAGFAVAVPTIEGLSTLRLRPEDAAPVRAAVDSLWEQGHRPVAVVGVSVGAGPALLGAAAGGGRISAVLALGGYGEAVELLRYTLTGAYGFGAVRGRRAVSEEAIARFAQANRDLVDAAGRALIDNREPEAFDQLAAALPAKTRAILDGLSPARSLARMGAPLFLVHGTDDATVPFTETLRLAAAARTAGVPVRAVVVGAVRHVEAGDRATLGDLVDLAAALHAFRGTAQGPRARYLGRPSPIRLMASRTGS